MSPVAMNPRKVDDDHIISSLVTLFAGIYKIGLMLEPI
jgi:hypothetical protein